jgi:predicted heme/steroid binding protein
MKKFSERELIEYDGKNSRRAFIAFNGKVYDVTDSSKWREGIHFKAHSAGIDLSNALKDSTHGSEVLAGVRI